MPLTVEERAFLPATIDEEKTRLRLLQPGQTNPPERFYERPVTIPDYTDHLIAQGFLYLPSFNGKNVPGYGFRIPERMILPGRRILVINKELKREALIEKEPHAITAWEWYQEHITSMSPEELRKKSLTNPHPPGKGERELDMMILSINKQR
jgi:hypothetical protein